MVRHEGQKASDDEAASVQGFGEDIPITGSFRFYKLTMKYLNSIT